MQQESIPIREKLKIRKIEGNLRIKIFLFGRRRKIIPYTMVCQWKDVLVCGHDDGEVDTNHCAACSVEYDKAEEWI